VEKRFVVGFSSSRKEERKKKVIAKEDNDEDRSQMLFKPLD